MADEGWNEFAETVGTGQTDKRNRRLTPASNEAISEKETVTA